MYQNQYSTVGFGRLGEVIRWGPLGPGGDPAAALQSYVPGVPVSGLGGLGAMTPIATVSAQGAGGTIAVDPDALAATYSAAGYVPMWWVAVGVAGGALLGGLLGRQMK